MAHHSTISQFLQTEMKRLNVESWTAVEAAKILDKAGVLKDSPHRPGLPLRNLLRDGKVRGGRQEANRRWFIDRKNQTT